MEIRQYTIIDVHYNESEEAVALAERKRLVKLGYELQVKDDSGFLDYCDQYIHYKKPFIKK